MKFLFYQLIMALCLFVKANIHGNIKLLDAGYEAEAFMQAHDYDKAATIFEQLAKEALPNWQHSLVIYNLGTVKLAQNLNEEALHDYQQVFLDAASTPQIIRSLFINQGIAFLKQAQSTNAETAFHELVEKMDLYVSSLNHFKKVEDLDCQLKKLEGEDLAAPCTILPDLETLILQAKIGLQETKQLYGDYILKSKPVWALSMLSESMQQLDKQIQSFISWKIPEEQQKEYRQYLLHQAESLQKIWEYVLNLSLNAEQKSAVNEAAAIYQQSLELIQKTEFTQASQKMNQAIKNMETVISTFQNSQLQLLLLNYQLVLLQNDWTAADLLKLKEEQLKLKELNPERLKLANEYLNTSIEYFNLRKEASEFYLTTAFQTLNEISPQVQNKPVEILSEILKKAWNVKKLIQLYPAVSENPAEAQSILESSQQQLLEEAKLFLPAVFSYEREAFKSKDPRVQRCQQQPWDRVIPLFDQGYQSALAAMELIRQQPMQVQEKQTNTITQWKEALRLMLLPSQPSSTRLKAENQDQEQKATSINEILRLIQEMQAQDQPQQQSPDKELHTW